MTILVVALTVVVFLFGFVVFRGAPYVPSKRKEIRQAFEVLYSLGEKDTLIDIGSGDGIVLREAARTGARAVGYELNPILVVLSRLLCRRNNRIRVRLADYHYVRMPQETTVVYVFGESRDIDGMAHKVAQEATRLNRTLAFISYGFELRGRKASKQQGAYFLYYIHPLQSGKP